MAYLDENGLEHFWGKIKDRVSSAVAPKANDADVVHKTGDETVEGVKVFSNAHATDPVSQPNLRASSVIIKSPDLVRGVVPEYKRHLNLQLVDSTGTDVGQTGRLGSMEYEAPMQGGDGHYGVYIRSWKFLPADDPNPSTGTSLFVGYDKDEIPYSTAPETSDDRTDSADIVTRGYMEASEWNWQKTKKNAVVQFKPVPESDLEPAVDFLFAETPPASGDKGPSNPSTTAGVTQAKVTRCGKNLCPLIGESSSSYISVSFTDNGEFVFNGSYIGVAAVYIFNKPNNKNLFPDYLERGKTYTFSLQGDNSSVIFRVYKYYNGGYGGAVVSIASGESQTYTIPDTQSLILRFEIPANTVLNNAKFKLQIEEGSSATEFEPYAGNDYTIQLGDTYYGGSLDVATGVMTVTYSGMVLDGTENWTAGATGSYNRYTLAISPNAKSVPRLENCTHFLAEGNLSTDTEHFYATGDGVHFFAAKPDLASWKSWLDSQNQAGTPVVFTYFIDSFTVQLTPTQIRSLPAIDKYGPRINTIYTDQEAVQVGYQRFYDENRIAAIEARLDVLEGN